MKKVLPFLAVAFSGFLVYLFDKIWGNSINWEKVKTVKIGEWLSTEISFKVYGLLLFIILSILVYLIARRFLKSDSYYDKKQEKLRKFNNLTDSQSGILFRWTVFFNFNNTPAIADLTPFCTKHAGPPMRFVNNRCPIGSCENSYNRIDLHLVKNHIESDLINRWETMK